MEQGAEVVGCHFGRKKLRRFESASTGLLQAWQNIAGLIELIKRIY